MYTFFTKSIVKFIHYSPKVIEFCIYRMIKRFYVKNSFREIMESLVHDNIYRFSNRIICSENSNANIQLQKLIGIITLYNELRMRRRVITTLTSITWRVRKLFSWLRKNNFSLLEKLGARFY